MMMRIDFLFNNAHSILVIVNDALNKLIFEL